MGQQTDIRICEQIIIQIVANQANDLFPLVFLFHKREQQNSAILNFVLIDEKSPGYFFHCLVVCALIRSE